MNNILDFIFDEDGQGLVEYGLLLTLVVIIVFISLHYFGKRLSNVYNFKIPDTK